MGSPDLFDTITDQGQGSPEAMLQRSGSSSLPFSLERPEEDEFSKVRSELQ
jgi:hypothetical protein